MQKSLELVSHPLIANFTLFLVDVHYRSRHLHSDLEFGLILSGTPTLSIADQFYQLEAGDIYLLNPMENHEISTSDSSTLILSMQFSPKLISSILPSFSQYHFESNIIHPNSNSNESLYHALQALFIELAYSYHVRTSNYELKSLNILYSILYIFLSTVPHKILTTTELNTQEQKSERINRIFDYVDQNFRHKLMLSDIARNEKLSLYYLSHFFKEVSGMSFQNYINNKRFDYACSLLRSTNKTILEISLECGFSDVRYLNQLCREKFECTPLELRNGIVQHGNRTKLLSADLQHFFNEQESIECLTTLRSKYHKYLDHYSLGLLYC